MMARSRRRFAAGRRGGFSYRGLILALVLLLALPAIAWSVLARWSRSSQKGGGPMMHEVKSGQFIHDVTERGNVESARNVEIVSKVKSSSSGAGSGGTTILEIVLEGTKILADDCVPERAVIPLTEIQKLEEYYRLNRFKLADFGTEHDPRKRPNLRIPQFAATSPGTVTRLTGNNQMSTGFPATASENGKDPSEGAASGGQQASDTATASGDGNGGADADGSLPGDPPEQDIVDSEDSDSEAPVLTFEDLKDKMILVKLDSSSLENQIIQQEIKCQSSRADLIQALNAFETAEIAYREYNEGTYVQERDKIKIQRDEALEEADRLKKYLEYSEQLHARGYVSDLELKTDRASYQRAQNKVELADLDLKTLSEFTRLKTLKKLDADIKTTEAKLKAAEANCQLDEEKLRDLREQITNCTIFATKPGQVVYANSEGYHGRGEIVIEEGTLIRERQAIIRLPDPTQMQIDAKINEGAISLVEEGMNATIQLDALPDFQLKGAVKEVSEYAAGTGWFGSAVREYQTIVSIDNPPSDIRPGMTASVKIRVEHFQDVLQLPVLAIIEHGARYYCVLRDGEDFQAREVTIAASNDKFVVIPRLLELPLPVVFHSDGEHYCLRLDEKQWRSREVKIGETGEKSVVIREGPETGQRVPAVFEHHGELYRLVYDRQQWYAREVKLDAKQDAFVATADASSQPVQPVFKHGGEQFLLGCEDEEWNTGGPRWKKREVKIATAGKKTEGIDFGLEAGEKVVLNAVAHRDQLGLPKLSPQDKRSPQDERDRPAEGLRKQESPGREETPGAAASERRGATSERRGAASERPGAASERPGAGSERPSPAEAFQRMDKNGDGQLETSELPAPLRPHVSTADTNGDGVLDRAEFTAAMAKLRGAGGRPQGPRPGAPQ